MTRVLVAPGESLAEGEPFIVVTRATGTEVGRVSRRDWTPSETTDLHEVDVYRVPLLDMLLAVATGGAA